VVKLRRTGIGFLNETRLSPGQWRELTPGEVKQFFSLSSAKAAGGRPAEKSANGSGLQRPLRRKPSQQPKPGKPGKPRKPGTPPNFHKRNGVSSQVSGSKLPAKTIGNRRRRKSFKKL